MSKIVKVATIFEENTRYIGRPENPIVKETTTSADKTPCATYTALPLTPGRIYKFTTTISSLMNWGAALVNSEGIITREFLPAVTNQPHAYTVIPVAGEVRMYINNRDYGEIEVTYDAEEANFMPGTYEKTSFRPFRFWCQTVLPLVYDDSLSYYELLSKVVDYLNNTINDLNTLTGEYAKIRDAYKELESFVNNYFDTLDVSSEINAKLDQMAEDGDFDELMRATLESLDYVGLIGNAVSEQIGGVVGEQIGATVGEQIDAVVGEQIDGVVGEQIDGVVGEQIGGVVGEQIGGAVNNRLPGVVSAQINGVVAEQIGGVVENWLGVNFTEPPVDESLTMSGAAADAKIVGNALDNAKDIEIENYKKKEVTVGNISTVNPGYVRAVTGNIGETVTVVSGGEFPTSVKVVRSLMGGETYHVKMTFPATGGVVPVVTKGYNAESKTAKFIEFASGNWMNPGQTYDFYVKLPYNATEIICVVQNNTTFSVSRVTNHFERDYEIEIENYKNKEDEMTPSNTLVEAYISRSGATVNATDWYAKIYSVKSGDKIRINAFNTENASIVPAMFFANMGTIDYVRIDAAVNSDADEEDYIDKVVEVPDGITTLVINSEGGGGRAKVFDPFKFEVKSKFNFADNLSIEGYEKNTVNKVPTTSYANQAFNANGVLVEATDVTARVYAVNPEDRYLITTENTNYPVYSLWNGSELIKNVYYNEGEDGKFYVVIPADCDKMFVNGKGIGYGCEIVDVTDFLSNFAQLPKVAEWGMIGDWSPVAHSAGQGAEVTYDWRKAIPEPPTNADDEYTLKARVINGNITYVWVAE